MIDLVCPLILVGVESISKDFNLVAWFNVVEHMQKYMCSLYKRIETHYCQLNGHIYTQERIRTGD